MPRRSGCTEGGPTVDIKPIKSEAGYEATLKEMRGLFDAEPGTLEADRVEVLATLVEAYEANHHPIPLPDPIEAIEYHMESRGLERKDLEPYIGYRSRVSEILNRRRRLTLDMIRGLSDGLGIPAEILVQPYELASTERVPEIQELSLAASSREERASPSYLSYEMGTFDQVLTLTDRRVRKYQQQEQDDQTSPSSVSRFSFVFTRPGA